MTQFKETYIEDIKNILEAARQKSYVAINTSMVEAYWYIGKRIVEEEQKGEKRAAYGEAIIKELSIALTGVFGKGFSLANLKNFRQFFLTFSQNEIGYTLSSQLTWSHLRLIMRLKNNQVRHYYITETANQQWSVRVLERHIATQFYERLLSSTDAIPLKSSFAPQNQRDFIKDPYVFEFLNMPEPQEEYEAEIEQQLINNLQDFLLELGKGFSFVARQFRISSETEHFTIDLVFYNYILKCFVLFDLKTHKLRHKDIGQMDMYVRMFDDLKRTESDNPTIGIVLCTDKDQTVVKYSLLNDSEQVFAARYFTYLPSEAELIAEIEREKSRIERYKKEQGLPPPNEKNNEEK